MGGKIRDIELASFYLAWQHTAFYKPRDSAVPFRMGRNREPITKGDNPSPASQNPIVPLNEFIRPPAGETRTDQRSLNIKADNRLGIICLLLYHCAQMVSTMVMLWIRFMGPYTAKATEKRRIRRMSPNSDQGMPHGSPHFCPISMANRSLLASKPSTVPATLPDKA